MFIFAVEQLELVFGVERYVLLAAEQLGLLIIRLRRQVVVLGTVIEEMHLQRRVCF
jgi:hypothetical protein